MRREVLKIWNIHFDETSKIFPEILSGFHYFFVDNMCLWGIFFFFSINIVVQPNKYYAYMSFGD